MTFIARIDADGFILNIVNSVLADENMVLEGPDFVAAPGGEAPPSFQWQYSHKTGWGLVADLRGSEFCDPDHPGQCIRIQTLTQAPPHGWVPFDALHEAAQLRTTAHAAIERWRDTQESAGMFFEHAGRRWDGGLIVRQRLQPVLLLPALPPGFFWTDAGNADVPMDMPALQALAAAHEQALVIRGFEIHARQRAMKNALDAMTRDELLAFAPGWPIEPITTGDQ